MVLIPSNEMNFPKSVFTHLNEAVIYNVNSFSSLIACCLVRLEEQFFRALLKYFSSKHGSAPCPEKLVRIPRSPIDRTGAENIVSAVIITGTV